MTFASELVSDIDSALSYGEKVRFKYYNQTSMGEYSDDVVYTQSGNDYWCSGLICPIDSRTGGYDTLLLQQGKILMNDKKIYVRGDIQTSGLGKIKIGTTGSPTTREYEILNEGQVTGWEVNGSVVYKKIYVRYLTNGSFVGE